MRLAAILFTLGLTPVVARAQQDSILVFAMRLASEGQGDSAQAFVRGYLEQLPAADPQYAEALYAAGVVAENTTDAQMYFRRVSIEFSQSAWADEALLRLAMLAYAEQDFAGALRAAERIVLDYPFSNVIGEANYWAARANLELGNPAAACPQLEQAEATAGENVELTNRIRFYRLRCTGLLGGAADSARPRPAPAASGGFAVQVAALQSAAAADELMRALSAEGYDEVRAVQEEGYLKIRVGRFPKRADAVRLAQELSRKFGGSPFVVER